MTVDETRREDEFRDERTRLEHASKTRLEGKSVAETAREEGVPRSGGFSLAGNSFEGKRTSYRVLEEMAASGAEADIYIVQLEGADEKRILKYYRKGIRPKLEITEMLADLDNEHVVRVYETGERDGRSYEIQEFVEHGSLADMVTSGGLPEAQMKEVLHELMIAVEHLHERKVIHRDLKPANVLVRTKEPLDLVFIDFGISSQTELSLHATNASRTVSYASPEALTGVVAKASDWWSIGVILLELLTGRHPFEGLNEQAVNFQLVSKGIEVPDDIPVEWNSLLKGLLTRDRERRWGAEQLVKWLDGDRSIPLAYDAANPNSAATKTFAYQPYKFEGEEIFEPGDLAVQLGMHWPQGVKHFGRGYVKDWILQHVCDQDLAARLDDVIEDDGLDANQRLSVAIMLLDSDLPLMDRNGSVITRKDIGSLDSFREILQSNLGLWLSVLRDDDWLLDLADDYDQLNKQLGTLPQSQKKLVDEKLTKMFFLLDEEELQEKWVEFKSVYAECLLDSLADEMAKRNPSRYSKIALLSVPVTKLKTHELLRQETLQADLSEFLEIIDFEKALTLSVLPADEIDDEFNALRKRCGGCVSATKEHRYLSKLLSSGQAAYIEKLAALSLPKSDLNTHEELREKRLRRRIGKRKLSLINFSEALLLDSLTKEELNERFRDFRKLFGGAKGNDLDVAIRSGDASRIQQIVALTMPESELKTHECVRRDKLTSDLLGLCDLGFGHDLDFKKALDLDLLPEDQLDESWKCLREDYAGCSYPSLNEALLSGAATRLEKIALLSLNRELLQTPGEVLREKLKMALAKFWSFVRVIFRWLLYGVPLTAPLGGEPKRLGEIKLERLAAFFFAAFFLFWVAALLFIGHCSFDEPDEPDEPDLISEARWKNWIEGSSSELPDGSNTSLDSNLPDISNDQDLNKDSEGLLSETLSSSPPDIRVPSTPIGRVSLKTRPSSGVGIYIDGEYIGQTPFPAPLVFSSNRSAMVEARFGELTDSRRVLPVPGRVTEVNFDFIGNQLPGNTPVPLERDSEPSLAEGDLIVNISSGFGGSSFHLGKVTFKLDGSAINPNVRFALPRGVHRLEFNDLEIGLGERLFTAHHLGFRRWEKKIQLNHAKPLELDVLLEQELVDGSLLQPSSSSPQEAPPIPVLVPKFSIPELTPSLSHLGEAVLLRESSWRLHPGASYEVARRVLAGQIKPPRDVLPLTLAVEKLDEARRRELPQAEHQLHRLLGAIAFDGGGELGRLEDAPALLDDLLQGYPSGWRSYYIATAYLNLSKDEGAAFDKKNLLDRAMNLAELSSQADNPKAKQLILRIDEQKTQNSQ